MRKAKGLEKAFGPTSTLHTSNVDDRLKTLQKRVKELERLSKEVPLKGVFSSEDMELAMKAIVRP
jgi:hypothetical protein